MENSEFVKDRSSFITAMVQANGGTWPDLEQLVAAVYTHHVKPGDLVFDVGVNHGTHLFQLANIVGPAGNVIGVEAVPAFADGVRKRLKAHEHLTRRVTLHTCAVAAQAGAASFFVTSITDGGLSGLRLRPVIKSAAFERIVVETRTLDDLFDPERAVSFVKIDIEGGEYDALRGAPLLLARHPLIAFEFDSSAPEQFGFDANDLLRLLWDAGYRVCDIFGFEVESEAAMMQAVVWNFVAVPEGQDMISVTAPARRILETRFPGLSIHSPVSAAPRTSPPTR